MLGSLPAFATKTMTSQNHCGCSGTNSSAEQLPSGKFVFERRPAGSSADEPAPASVNLGLGYEPEQVDPVLLEQSARAILDCRQCGPMPVEVIKSARNKNCWFYWCYAASYTILEIYDIFGADRLGAQAVVFEGEKMNDGTTFAERRASNFRQLLAQRFGLNLN